MGHEVVIFRNRYCRFHDFFLVLAVAAMAKEGIKFLEESAAHEASVLRDRFVAWLGLAARPEAGIDLRLDEVVTTEEQVAVLMTVARKAKDSLLAFGSVIPVGVINSLLSRSMESAFEDESILTARVVLVLDQLIDLFSGNAPFYRLPQDS